MSYNQLQLAEALVQDGELVEALNAIATYLDAFPADPDARRLRAGILLRIGEGDQLEIALGDLSSLPELTPEDLINCATIWERLGNTEQALTVLEDGLNTHPGHPRLTEHLLILLKAQGQLERAYQTALGQPGDDWRWHSWTGELAEELGDHDEAIRHFTIALEQIGSQVTVDPTQPTRFQSSTMMEMALYGNYARLLLARGNAHQYGGNLSQAEIDFAEAGELLPNDPTILFKQGVIGWQQGSATAAIILFQQAFAWASPAMREQLRVQLATYPDLLLELRQAGLLS